MGDQNHVVQTDGMVRDDRKEWGKSDDRTLDVDSGSNGSDRNNDRLGEPVDWRQAWNILRPVIVIWSFVVWIVITAPLSISKITDTASLINYLPLPMIALSVLGASTLAMEYGQDVRMVLFILISILIAGLDYEF